MNAGPVAVEEDVVRLLFAPDMVDDARLMDAAFPMDELMQVIDKKTGKRKSASVSRYSLLQKPAERSLLQKLNCMDKPGAKRAKWGWCCARVEAIREIRNALDRTMRIFDVEADPLLRRGGCPPDPAHAKVVANAMLSRGAVRSYRDKLIAAFQARITAAVS